MMNRKREYRKYLISSTLDTANNRIASASFISAFAMLLTFDNKQLLYLLPIISLKE